MIYIKIIAVALLVSQLSQGVSLLKRKPFTCSLCLAFWITLFTELYLTNHLISSFGMACVLALLTSLTDFIYVRLIRYLA
jgi:hypothetical protein